MVKRLHVAPDTPEGLTVHLKLSSEDNKDFFRWFEKSDHTYLTNYATVVFMKHIRELREREKE